MYISVLYHFMSIIDKRSLMCVLTLRHVFRYFLLRKRVLPLYIRNMRAYINTSKHAKQFKFYSIHFIFLAHLL